MKPKATTKSAGGTREGSGKLSTPGPLAAHARRPRIAPETTRLLVDTARMALNLGGTRPPAAKA